MASECDSLQPRRIMFLLSALVLATADSEAAAEPIASFRCNKAAFYPTAGAFKDKAGGTRHVLLPEAMCASVATDHEVMQALCCANTRVNCSTAVTAPTLVSYDGSHYALKNEQSRKPSTAATVLADADRRLCSMMMADKCSDCDRSKCSLFSKAPAAKSCYGRTYVDKPDGSGWLKKDALKLATADIGIATFDGVPATTFRWSVNHDGAMGGQSHGTFTINSTSKVGVLNGICADEPFLRAPGSIAAVACDQPGGCKFPDVSSCKNLVLNVNSANSYGGFFVSFGVARYPSNQTWDFTDGHRSSFNASVGEFGDVTLPFSGFTDHWDLKTGLPITKCSDDQKACPTKRALQNFERISIWA
eukprot:SAG31_NODE_10466_length_1135_cov_1.238417_1_plen_360_part_01